MLPEDNSKNVDPYSMRNVQQYPCWKMVRISTTCRRKEGRRRTEGLDHSVSNKDYSKNSRGTGNGSTRTGQGVLPTTCIDSRRSFVSLK